MIGRVVERAGRRVLVYEPLGSIKVPGYVIFMASLSQTHVPTHRVAKFKPRSNKALKEHAVDREAGLR